MPSTIYGSINYKEKSFPFFLEEERVRIVGSAWEYTENFRDADCEEYISGITSDNRLILFLKCKFCIPGFENTVSFFPIGYILSRDNVGNPYNFTFERLTFYSDALNKFYPPKQAMTTDFNFENWDGSITIGVKPFDETSITFNYKESKCELNMYRDANLQVDNSDIGNLKSTFSFEFDTEQPCKELPQYWLALFDFLSFINYGTDIKFEKVELSNRRADGLFFHYASAYIFSSKKEYLPRHLPKRITVTDIPAEKLGAVFSKIASLREGDKKLSYYIPDNYSKELQIDTNQWLVKAMAFEGLFKDCFPSFKQNNKKQFRTAKAVALEVLHAVDTTKMSKHERNYFDDCKKQIERYEGLLKEMLDFTIKKYKKPLNDLLEFNLQNFNVKINEYGTIYSNFRNKNAHGDITPLKEKEIAVFNILQATIYLLLLKDTELDDDVLRVIVKKLFL